MRINNNIMAMNTHRQYGVNNANVSKSVEKLSSGFRINRAGDDAAGLAISEKMRAQIRGLSMASKNSQDAISLVQTAEGALQETHNILQRMRELAVQSASDTNETTIDRDALNKEFQALIEEIDDTADKTKFNEMGLINGDFSKFAVDDADTTSSGWAGSIKVYASALASKATAASAAATPEEVTVTLLKATADKPATLLYGTEKVDLISGQSSVTFSDGLTIDFGKEWDGTAAGLADIFGDNDATTGDDVDLDIEYTVTAGKDFVVQTGANKGDELAININKMDAVSLGVGIASVDNRANASFAIKSVNDAINRVSSQRADLGALQNRLEHKIANLDTSTENLQAAESRIRDLDMAKEMTNFTKNNILSQASTAMLAQANALPQGVLQLLR